MRGLGLGLGVWTSRKKKGASTDDSSGPYLEPSIISLFGLHLEPLLLL